MATVKSTAFTVGLRSSDLRGAPKPKTARRGPFRYLRKDEGHRADGITGTAAADQSDEASSRRANESRQHRESLMQAIQSGKLPVAREHDPFAESTVAVPKKPPPGQISTRTSEERTGSTAGDSTLAAHRQHPPTPRTHVNAAEDAHEYAEDKEPPNLQQTKKPHREKRHGPSAVGDEGQPHTARVRGQTEEHAAPERFADSETDRAADEQQLDDEFDRAGREEVAPRTARRVAPPSYYSGPPGDRRTSDFDRYGRQEEPEPPLVPRRSHSHQVGSRRQAPPSSRYADPLDDDRVGGVIAEDGYDNFFPTAGRRNARAAPPPSTRVTATEPDDELMAELERQLEAVKEEKAKYQRLVQEAAKRRDQEVRSRESLFAELQAEREDFEAYCEDEKKTLRREKRALEEQRKRQNETLASEKETNRRLQQELDAARDALDKLSSEVRDKDRVHRTEAERLRRQVADLQARNDELTEMLRSAQAAEADRALLRPASEEQHRAGASRSTPVREKKISTTVSVTPSLSAEEDDEIDAAVDRRQYTTGGTRIVAGRGTRQTVEESRLGINHSAEAQRVAVASQRMARRSSPPMDDDFDTTRKTSAAPRGSTATPGRTPVRQPQSVHTIPTPEEFISGAAEAPPIEDIPGDAVTARNIGTDGKTEQLFRSGKRVITYANGTRKVVLQSGHVVLHFSNGDVKRTFPSGKTTYWYAVAQTTHIQMPDGLQIFQFHASNQTEKHYPDGRKEILYPEGIFKTIAADGSEVTYFPDGSVSRSGPLSAA